MTAQGGGQPAAGALVWRRESGVLQVALVHRPRYDDWSWPKGKLDPGECWAGAAAREVLEETGLRPRLGIPLPRAVYGLRDGSLKEVRYWAAQAVGGTGTLENEIDRVEWLTPPAARERLTYARDSLQLQALLDADRRGALRTWVLVVVRHGDAVSRSSWDRSDTDRPLTQQGKKRAAALTAALGAYGVHRLISSPSARCTATVAPFAHAHHLQIKEKRGLSEEVFANEPGRAVRHLERALDRGEFTALCTHRPVLPALLHRLAGQATPGAACTTLLERARDGLEKGEALICQMVDVGEAARVVSVERNRP
ncbi:NUDIX domain-containing protein [Allobranchiibius sp. GilTou38]|uniref:NUDIX domain-containing protein n=1 Tax=Allobranchiibius sp. GilTou38 TaxID=2815210 RepID=UPI001AA1B05D|nr:NUDIX hydrolase [Allobranchiibius sp. GilTou38]